MADLIAIAHLRRTRGNKGELIGDSLTSHPERFQKLNRVFLVKAGTETREMEVERVWDFRGEPVFQFAGIDSISAAEPFAGFDVCVPADERVELEEGEYFFDDIVGCQAFDPQGSPIGTVAGWQEGPGLTWFDVEENGRTYLVPFNREIFREIDVEARRVTLDLPEGLRELN
ncbi:hypothetical protein F183_A00570 [Bryobacterales bacterium F-183]|nr:hypothetical protein F183_A00570 [Bryobacterales bacterium F-183]